MSKGGFTLRKWNTNSKELRARIESEPTPGNSQSVDGNLSPNDVTGDPKFSDNDDRSQRVKFDTPNEDCWTKILEMSWNVLTDELQCDTSELLAYICQVPSHN
jgi:hypothetical protein